MRPSSPGAAGSPYTTSLAATGGTGTYTWTITSGALPPGLNWSNGTISGTPTAAAVAGTYSFTAQAADTQNADGHQDILNLCPGNHHDEPARRNDQPAV